MRLRLTDLLDRESGFRFLLGFILALLFLRGGSPFRQTPWRASTAGWTA